MFELEKTEEVERLILITKSNSGISGPELAKAHIRLGELVGEHIDVDPKETTVVAVLRGGLFFAQGIYFSLGYRGCRFQLFDPKKEAFVRPDTKNVILADAVINTGKTIIDILEPDMKVACCVINENAVPKFADQLYTARVSKNSFVGSNVKVQSGNKGPDTTMRLFNLPML